MTIALIISTQTVIGYFVLRQGRSLSRQSENLTRQGENIQRIETQTNAIKDALVAKTEKEAYARGHKEGLAEQKAPPFSER